MQVSETLENLVNRWVDLDDTEKAAREDIKIVVKEKRELTQQILEFMKANNLKAINIQGKDGNGGTLEYTVSKRSSSINRDAIRKNLLACGQLRSPNAVDNVVEYIYTNRDVKEVPCLKRKKSRK